MSPPIRNTTNAFPGIATKELRLVERLAHLIVREPRVESVMQKLADELVKLFGFKAVVVSQYDYETNGFRVLGIAPQKKLLAYVSKVLKVRLADFLFPFVPKGNKVLGLLTKGKVWIGNDAAEMFIPVFSPKVSRTLQRFLGIRCLYNSPLMIGKQIIGTVIIGSAEGSFSKSQQAFLKTVTHHAALAVYQARMISDHRKRTEQYRLLGQADSHILEEKNLEKVLAAIVENIHTVIPCDLAGVYLYDAKRKILFHSVSSKRTPYARKLPQFDIPLDKGIIGFVARTRKARIVNNAEKDPRSVYPPGKRPKLEHLVCLPLIANRKLLGVMHVGRFRDDPFRDTDLEIARQFGEKSALAIENAQLIVQQQRRERDLEALHRSGTKITETLDQEKVLKRILEEALKTVPAADRGSIMLFDEATKELFIGAIVGYSRETQERFRLPWGKGVAGYVIRTKKSIIVDDVRKSRLWVTLESDEEPDVHSIVAVPLLFKDKAIGVLNLDNTSRKSGFTHQDVSRLELFAVHAALAISNSKLLSSVRDEVRKVKLLREIKDLALKGLSTSKFLDGVCRQMVAAYDYNLTTVLLYNAASQTMKLVAASGPEASLVPKDYEQSIERGIVGWVGRNKKLRLVQDASVDPYFVNVSGLSTKAELSVPILDSDDNLLGVINTESNHVYAFTETDVEAQAAVAAEIAGAFAEQRLLNALSESERKFRRLFEETKDAIYVSTPDGRLIDANPAAVDLFGYAEKNELLGANIENHLSSYSGDKRVQFREIGQGGYLKDVELRLRKKDGNKIVVYATITAIKDVAGEAVAYQGILRDITRQKEAEQRLQESEEKYRGLVEDSLVGVYIIQEGRFAFVNKRFAEIFGYSSLEITQTLRVEDLVFPADRKLVLENIWKRLSGEVKSIRYGFRGVRKNGELIEVEVYGTASAYLGRRAVIGTILDQTQQARSQREIAEWRQRYDLIIASSGGIVYEYDLGSGTILWSGSIEKVLGYNLTDLRGDISEWEQMIHPEDRAMAVRELEFALQDQKPYDVEYRFARKDGSYIWMHDRGFFVTDQSGQATKMLGLMEDVTGQKELEQRVRSSELKHRLLFEHANDAVFVMQGEMFIDCNPRAAEMFGCNREDLVGQTPYSFSPPYQVDGAESKQESIRRIEAALAGDPQRFPWRHIKRDGTLFEAEILLNKFELQGRTLLQAQVRDITAEVDAREELARSEEKYRQLVLEAGEAIVVTDGEGRIIEVNDRACAMLRYSRAALLERTVSDLSVMPKEEADSMYRRFYARLIEDRSAGMIEQTIKRSDGTEFHSELSAALLGNGMLQAIIRDTSEKKQAERELDQIYTLATTLHGKQLFDKASTTLADLLEMEHVIVGQLGHNGKNINALTCLRNGNRISEFEYELHDTPSEEVLKKREPCVHPAGVAALFPGDPYLKEWGIESFIGIPLLNRRREVIGIACLMDPGPHTFSDHEKKIISIIAQRLASELDMLDQRKREEQLSQQLLQSQKMESLGTLAGGVAHDFNNILGAVIGYTSLVKRHAGSAPQIGRYLEAIEKSAQRAASLSRQLLSFSHKTQGEISPVSVNDLVNDTVHILKSSFPKNIRIETNLSPLLPKVLGDQNLLGQVIMNLCINARDAIQERPAGASEGVLKIETSQFVATEGFIDVHLSAAPGEYACINVSDNGVGMTASLRQRIFEPFFTTKGKGRGTGLGLSMVYGIVRNHNGFIDVYSEVQQGTSFKIFLPVSPEGEGTRIIASEEELPMGNGEVIMVVEDEPVLCDLVADVLQGQGYGVLLASNGKEAVNLYERERDKVKLVILDMIMPEMDGPATFEVLRSMNPHVKVLISSGFSQDSSVQRMINSGASGFVSKPYQTEELLRLVAKELHSNDERHL